MSFKLNNNIATSSILRNLANAGKDFAAISERLSSGQRINRASDGVVDLAIADKLNTDVRIYSQSKRNIEDGISLLNTFDSALETLQAISGRQKEILTLGSNGILGHSQRVALQEELDALSSEYNRILETAEFNDRKLFDEDNESLSIQVGGSSIHLSIGNQHQATVGNGEFTFDSNLAVGDSPRTIKTYDLNSDGNLDLVSSNDASGDISVVLGNGDGTFAIAVTYGAGSGAYSLEASDFNNDGVLDLVTANSTDNTISVLIGSGSGTFATAVSYAAGNTPRDVVAADFNSDGFIDIINTNQNSANLSIFLGDGSGTFSTMKSFSFGGAFELEAADFNNDGVLDLIAVETTLDRVSILTGNGDGSFTDNFSIGTSFFPFFGDVADLNRDGNIDFVVGSRDGEANVFFGNGDGTLTLNQTLNTGNREDSVIAADANGDGILDIIAPTIFGANQVNVFLGNSDGSFDEAVTSTINALQSNSIVSGDFNGDGILDIVNAEQGSDRFSVSFGDSRETNVAKFYSVFTQSEAQTGLSEIDDQIQRISLERGNIGANISRLSFSLSHTESLAINAKEASDKITSIDTAYELANLVKTQILQQVNTALLAQVTPPKDLIAKLLN